MSILFLFIMVSGYAAFNTNLNITAKGNIIDNSVDITENIVTDGDGLYRDLYEKNRYIYRGENPDNYIEFNNELWRIMAKEADGSYKIVKNELLNNGQTMSYDIANNRSKEDNSFCTRSQYGCGVFAAINGIFKTPNERYSGTVIENSSLANYLNGEYYNDLKLESRAKVKKHTFYIGSVQVMDINDSLNKNITDEKAYEWQGFVGLPNVSDILRASINPNCTSATDQYNALSEQQEFCDINYLLDLSNLEAYWTISAFSNLNNDYSNLVWHAGYFDNGKGLASDPAYIDNYSGVRPVVFLDSGIRLRGSGTKQSPYQII